MSRLLKPSSIGTHNVKNGAKCLQLKEEATLNMSPLPRLLAYQWNALTNLYGMLGGENLGVRVY